MPRTAWVLGVTMAALASAQAVRAALPVTVVHETKITVDVRLDLLGDPYGGTLAEKLTGRPGQTLSLAHTFSLGAAPVRVFLALTPDPDEPRAQCRVRLVTDTRWAGTAAKIDRVLNVPPDRLTVTELWSAPTGGARLVLGLTATWADVPRLVPVEIGAEPVEFVVTAQLANGGERTSVDERHLTTLVGAPVRYTLQRAAAQKDGAAPESGGTLVLELQPLSIRGGELEVTGRASLDADQTVEGSGNKPPRRETMVTERVPLGGVFDLVVPLDGLERALVFRVTPYF